MPLSEFLRMARGKLESGQVSCPTDLSSRPESDVVELVWENGQITTNGQSSRMTRAPAPHNLPSIMPRVRDSGVGHATTSRIGKFGGVESFLNETTPIVPSGNLVLTQDDDMDPWLNYPMDDALPHYFLPEISGVTANGISADNSFLSADKRSSFDQSASNLNNCGNAMKASSSKAHVLSSWPHQQGQISDPSLRSGVSDIISNNVSKPADTTYGSSGHCKDVINDTNAKMERQNMGQLSNNSNFLNFSCFSRPTPFKANIASSNGVPTSVSSVLEGREVKAKGSTSTGSNPVKSPREERTNTTQKGIDFHAPATLCAPFGSKQPVAKESFPAERNDDFFRESSTKNEKPLIPGNITADATKGHQDGERSMEPMVASSSVGSGNSVDRISCEQTHNSKRKFADTEETEWRSDELGTESAGVNKPTSARGGNGSKRSRAAEVHNLSERRRRDRINEKMRALQELIPNCNKADKASMLDEAIEYLKTLQLQVQIMSMGAGLCMPQMMFPQHMHPAHMPHYSPMGVGMGYGMGMVDMHGGTHGMPVLQGAHFPSQMSGPINFQRFPGPNPPVYGHPSQGHPNTLPGAPLAPLTGRPPITSALGLTPSRVGSHNEMPVMSPCLNSESPAAIRNGQSMHNGEASKSTDCSSKQVQAAKDSVLDQSTAVKENTQAPEVRGTPAALTSITPTDINKEAGGD